MHEWYFSEGGLFLSERSRIPYFLLKDAIQRVVEDKDLADNPNQPIPNESRRLIVKIAGRLRASLAKDFRRTLGISRSENR